MPAHRTLFGLALLFGLTACASESQPVEVTRIVEVRVEVTRLVVVTPTIQTGGEFGSAECDAFMESLLDLADEWTDAYEVAGSTARIALSDRIVEMQELRRRASNINEPSCGDQLAAKGSLLVLLDAGIDLFSRFMVEEDTSRETARLVIAQDTFGDISSALLRRESKLPRRVHYYADSNTRFSVQYTDEFGEQTWVNIGGMGNEAPFLYMAIFAEGTPVALSLSRPASTDEELQCAIFVNGTVTVSASDTGRVNCEL